MLNKEDIISHIRSVFRDGAPSGIAVGWDADRFFEEISLLSKKGKLFNWTQFDYSFCNTFCFQVSAGDLRVREQAMLQISFVSDVFDVYWDRFTKHSEIGRRIVEPELTESKEWLQEVKQWLASKGFEELPGEWYNVHIEGLELELSESDEVTIGKCLFEDCY